MSSSRAAACVAVLSLISAACNQAAGAPQGPGGFPPATVKLETAQTAPVEDTTEYVGTLKSLRSTSIQPQIDGQITQMFVAPGDRVARGDRLMQIDPRRQQAAVSSQEAERAAREADLAYARQQNARLEELLKAGAISRNEAEQARTTLETAEARVKALDAQIQQEQVQLRYFTITAPTAGIVGDIPVRIGNQVTPQTLLTTIDQNETLELNVQVPVERASSLREGLPIRILTGDGTSELGATSINFVSPRVDDQTQSVLVKAAVRNERGALRAGQFVRARVVWNTTQGLVAPVTATLRINGQYFVFVAEESRGPDGKPALVARQRAIKVGPIVGDNYSVLEGLKPGDRVVVSGAQRLADGAPINPS